MCERELETEQRLQHIDLPSPSGDSRVPFSFSWTAQLEAWGPLRWVLFFLLHLVSNSSDLQLTDFLSSPSYIIVQSPTQYLPITGHRNVSLPPSLEGMFDRHQAETTVMQFTDHSLPVNQSVTVPRDFTLSHIVSQAHLRDFFP